MIKVSILGMKTKTIPVMRYLIKNSKELNEFRIPLLVFKDNRMNHLEKDFNDTIHNNSNNYRKIMHTYFEPYD
jgi:hypothetical protein